MSITFGQKKEEITEGTKARQGKQNTTTHPLDTGRAYMRSNQEIKFVTKPFCQILQFKIFVLISVFTLFCVIYSTLSSNLKLTQNYLKNY